MNTRKPISTISYLTEPYLVSRLSQHLDNGNIIFWAYICHKADTDMTKPHIHVYAEPAKTINTLSFNSDFIQPVSGDLPLRCLEWRNSKFDDWYLYGLHDLNYLNLKGHVRKFHYSDSDFWVSSMDEFELRKSLIDYSSFVSLDSIVNYAVSQVPIHQAIKDGVLPLSQLGRYVNLYRTIKSDSFVSPPDLEKKYGRN